jgi:hypothetical protein
MSFYSHFGHIVEIVGNAGEQHPSYLKYEDVLLKVRVIVGEGKGQTFFQFRYTLRADGGLNAIESAIATAPKLTLNAAQLQAALKEAE